MSISFINPYNSPYKRGKHYNYKMKKGIKGYSPAVDYKRYKGNEYKGYPTYNRPNK